MGTLRNWMKNLKIFNPNTSQKPVENNDMTTPENNLAVEDAFDNQDLIPDEPLDDPQLDSNIEPDRIEGVQETFQTSPTLESDIAAYCKRSKRSRISEEFVQNALKEIRDGQSIGASSKKYNIPS